ncbi:glycosyltransferase [Methylocystis sp. B8]|uniref:glycosyltransferase n=1 Tax=Methylocystis sp. B8 TaxID=544938 RepID=UPI0010FE46E5|nr:glycosyltransferase [Methylocystis sp. B8]TLG77625.1 glycosyltransferase family 4 protein [Methylocystis sp. B8]
MIRVGFILEFAGNGWLGGTSYYRNLFSAIADLPERRIDPVLITSSRGFEPMKSQFPDVAVVSLPLLDAPSVVGKARRVMRVLSGRDILIERALKSENIRILSHSGYFGQRSRIASIVWIPDFQELTFPGFFSERELAARRRNASNCCRHASTVLLSSQAALSDLRKIGVRDIETAVLPFVASVPLAQDILPRDQLRTKYGVADKFFHLPNQFWIHKNHIVVLEALALLRQQGAVVEVIATGNTADPRQPDYFSSLTATALRLGIEDLFKPLGVVPYQDLMSLMRHAVAVINPSKFEGWSTTVEEAKSMGKAIVLSDIPVHREQAPDRAAFFPADDARSLAKQMWEAWNRWDADEDVQFVDRAAANLVGRRAAFARHYEEIVLSTLDRHGAGVKRTAVFARQSPQNR